MHGLMERLKHYGLMVVLCCLAIVLGGCETDDDYRGYILSGRWFGDLGMMIDGQPAIGSDLEFIPNDYYGYTQGYGYETDYYRGFWGIETVEHYFTWMVRDGIIYLRFDDPDLDCNIHDYSLSPDYFEGYMDGIYSSVWFSLRNYDRYWNRYGYFDNYYPYRLLQMPADSLGIANADNSPECVRRVNLKTGEAQPEEGSAE